MNEIQSLMKSNLKSVISLIDKLRDVNLQSFITLPKIVAVGGQSAGKSSLIQQIVGLDFLPRGSGVVTRRPLQIRMNYIPTLTQSYAIFDEEPNKKYTDFTKVKQTIQLLTDKICGNKSNIVDKAIILKVFSSNTPNLTIIDLPGLTRISLEEQVKNIYEVTTNMIKKYMQEQSTIILCVIPANQDITNDQVLSIARKIDPDGKRTIGCITKIDIMDRGTDARLLLSNKGDVTLKMGFVGIKNRAQEDINLNLTVAESLEREKKFFSLSPIYASLPLQVLGTSSLVKKLTSILTESINRFLPTLLERIVERKAVLSETIGSYGKGAPQTQQQIQVALWNLCDQLMKELKKIMKGQLSRLKQSKELQILGVEINKNMRQILMEEYEEDIDKKLNDEKIDLAIRKHQGQNIPGFPSIHSFMYLITPMLQKLKQPLLQTLYNIHTLIKNIISIILNNIAWEFNQFRQIIFAKVVNILNTYHKKCNNFISKIIQAEINYIYINQESNPINQPPTRPINPGPKSSPQISLLRTKVKYYYSAVIHNLRDLVPKHIHFMLLNKGIQQVESQLFITCSGVNAQTKNWFASDPIALEQRKKNQAEFAAVTKAENYLNTYEGFALIRRNILEKRKRDRERQLREKRKANAKKQEPNQQGQSKKKDVNNEEKKQRDNPHRNNYTSNGTHSQEKVEKEKKKKNNIFTHLFGTNKDNQEPEQEKTDGTKKMSQKQKNDSKSNNRKADTSVKSSDNQIIKNKVNNSQQIKHKHPLFGEKKDKNNENENDKNKEKEKGKDKEKFSDAYNRNVNKMTDKTVDKVFANQKFQKQSQKAVEKGASVAAQKQLGVSKQTAETMGKGVGWLFKQDTTQNYLKAQAKKNANNQLQLK